MDLAPLLALVAPPLCVCCGAPARVHDPLCRNCRRALTWLPVDQPAAQGVPVWAPVSFEGPARELVRALKYRGAIPLVGVMAAQMAANAPPELLEGRSLVPVPLSPARRRSRGFNQAEVLARTLARRTALPVTDCLERVAGGARSTQVGRGRDERVRALAGGIRVRPGKGPPPRVLIVDDVVTTGSTLAACARALREAGSGDVRAIAYARTPGR